MRRITTIFEQKGISPVIGVILLVAVTVALVALATFIVFDIGGDVNETSSSAVQTSTGSNGVQVQVLRNDNVEQFEVIGPAGKTDTIDEDVGGSLNIGDGAGQYIVKAILSDGSEEVIDTINVEEGSSASEVRTGTEEDSGTVSVNPEIEGATVQAVEDGFIIDETTTDEDGEYTIEYSENSELIVTVDNFEDSDLDNNLYAGATREMSQNENLTFEFNDEEFDTIDVGSGEEAFVTSGIDNKEEGKIYTVGHLQKIDEKNLNGDYEIVNNIDASITQEWGNGFKPIGDVDEEESFTGSLDGNENKISDLHLKVTDDDESIGLFSELNTAEVSNLEMSGEITDTGDYEWNSAGLLSAHASDSTVDNVEVSGIEYDFSADSVAYVSGNLASLIGTVEDDMTVNNVIVSDDIMLDIGSTTEEGIDENYGGLISQSGDNNEFENILLDRDFSISGESEEELIGSGVAAVISAPGTNSEFTDISMNGDFTIDGTSEEDDLISDETAGVISDSGGDSEFTDVSMNGDFTIDGKAEGDLIDDVTAGVIAEPNTNSEFTDVSMNGDFTINGTSEEDDLINDETAGVISDSGRDTEFTDVSMNGDFTINGKAEGDLINDETAGVIADSNSESNLSDISMNGDVSINGEAGNNLIDDETAGVISDSGRDTEFTNITMDGELIVEGEDYDSFYGDFEKLGDPYPTGVISSLITNPDNESVINGELSHTGEIIIEEKPEDDHINVAGIISEGGDLSDIDYDDASLSLTGTVEVGGDTITGKTDKNVAAGVAKPSNENIDITIEE